MLMVVVRHFALRYLLYGHYRDLPNLACVLELPIEVHRLNQVELAVLDAQGFALIQSLDLLPEKLDRFLRVIRASNRNR